MSEPITQDAEKATTRIVVTTRWGGVTAHFEQHPACREHARDTKEAIGLLILRRGHLVGLGVFEE